MQSHSAVPCVNVTAIQLPWDPAYNLQSNNVPCVTFAPFALVAEPLQRSCDPGAPGVGNLVKLSPWPARARSGNSDGSVTVTTAAEDDAGPSLLLSPPAPLGTDVCGGAAVSFPPPREDRVYCMVPFLWAPKGRCVEYIGH